MATQKPGSILGGLKTGTAIPVDPALADQENKELVNETPNEEEPVTQIVDPENVNQSEGGEGEAKTNTPNPDNEAGVVIKDEATGLVVPTSKNPYQANPNLDRPIGEVGNAGQAEGEVALLARAKTLEANAISDEAREQLTENRKQRRNRPLTEDEYARVVEDSSVPQIVAAYKHKAVRHFKVGPFEFQNHILYLTSEDAHEEFLDAWGGLQPRDQNEIVQYDWEAAARVEQPVNRSAARGSMSTRDIKDAKTITR